MPGLPQVQSQLIVPLVAHNELLGVLCLQSTTPGRFLSDDERVVQIAARQLAASMVMLRRPDITVPQAIPDDRRAVPSASTSIVKHYHADDSIFIDDAYLIKGIAGRILWKLLREHTGTGRADFTNKEIRLDASLQLPDIKDNLETRLILLRRRLAEHCEFVRLAPAGRGQLHLEVHRKLKLVELP